MSFISLGELLTLVWCIAALLLNMSYNCNIRYLNAQLHHTFFVSKIVFYGSTEKKKLSSRAYLLSPVFEKPVNTISDLIKRGKPMLIGGFTPTKPNQPLNTFWWDYLNQDMVAYSKRTAEKPFEYNNYLLTRKSRYRS